MFSEVVGADCISLSSSASQYASVELCFSGFSDSGSKISIVNCVAIFVCFEQLACRTMTTGCEYL